MSMPTYDDMFMFAKGVETVQEAEVALADAQKKLERQWGSIVAKYNAKVPKDDNLKTAAINFVALDAAAVAAAGQLPGGSDRDYRRKELSALIVASGGVCPVEALRKLIWDYRRMYETPEPEPLDPSGAPD